MSSWDPATRCWVQQGFLFPRLRRGAASQTGLSIAGIELPGDSASHQMPLLSYQLLESCLPPTRRAGQCCSAFMEPAQREIFALLLRTDCLARTGSVFQGHKTPAAQRKVTRGRGNALRIGKGTVLAKPTTNTDQCCIQDKADFWLCDSPNHQTARNWCHKWFSRKHCSQRAGNANERCQSAV